MARILSKLERVLEILCDGSWHTELQLCATAEISWRALNGLVHFLTKYELVDYDEAQERVKLQEDFADVLVALGRSDYTI